MLAPGLVEGDPDDDAGVVEQQGDHGVVLGEELAVALVVPSGIGVRGLRLKHGPLGPVVLFASADLVLPDEQAQAVAMVVKTARFHLDVLPHHVEAGVLQKLDVVLHGPIRRRREQAIGPKALIQGAEVEDWSAVERKAQVAHLVARAAQHPQACVRAHFVDGVARSLPHEAHPHIVQVRCVGRPRLREGYPQLNVLCCMQVHANLSRSDHLAAVVRHLDGAPDRLGSRSSENERSELQDPRLGLEALGHDLQALDVRLRDRLEPDSLPNAAGWSVPYFAGLPDLLSTRLAASSGILHANHDGVDAVHSRVGDLEAERREAAHVLADALIVDPNLAPVVYSFEVQEQKTTRHLGDAHLAVVPESLRCSQQALHAREHGL
mmetsp:Transcript_27454/g.78509  ORF Transcript_27454/g.78509 Transcript_27454/m.78509 type:complete len:379 (-) Transcript_27454:489-1625(-)